MTISEFNVKGIKLTIFEKPEHEMTGYKQPAKDDGSVPLFVSKLHESGKIEKLAKTLQQPQQVWVCLADCFSCGLNCSGFDFCNVVCIEKTMNHDFSEFKNDELFTFKLPASKWVRYESQDKDIFEYGIYDLVQEVGYKWNDAIPLHFDNQYDCIKNKQEDDNCVLLPVVPM